MGSIHSASPFDPWAWSCSVAAMGSGIYGHVSMCVGDCDQCHDTDQDAHGLNAMPARPAAKLTILERQQATPWLSLWLWPRLRLPAMADDSAMAVGHGIDSDPELNNASELAPRVWSWF